MIIHQYQAFVVELLWQAFRLPFWVPYWVSIELLSHGPLFLLNLPWQGLNHCQTYIVFYQKLKQTKQSYFFWILSPLALLTLVFEASVSAQSGLAAAEPLQDIHRVLQKKKNTLNDHTFFWLLSPIAFVSAQSALAPAEPQPDQNYTDFFQRKISPKIIKIFYLLWPYQTFPQEGRFSQKGDSLQY